MNNTSNKASRLIDMLRASERKLGVAESCTGGMISSALTDIAGSSDVFDRGFITYSNQSKIEMLGVDKDLLDTYGAVSKEVALAMAEGALVNSLCDISVAVTGIAGPNSDSSQKPVGLVYISIASCDKDTIVEEYEFRGDRCEIRSQSVQTALDMLICGVISTVNVSS